MRQKGWKVDVLSPITSNIVIQDLKEFENGYPFPAFPINFYTTNKKISVVEDLVNIINDDNYEEIIIETNSINAATWAEAIAEIIQAKHFAYPLGETFVITNKGVQNYLVFKHQRRELAGIDKDSLAHIFQKFSPIDINQSYYVYAYCNNVEADVDSPFLHSIKKEKYDSIVGCLSRLDKPFVIPAIKEFCQYANENKDKKFFLLLMGDKSVDKSKDTGIGEIIKSQTNNVDYVMTGNLYPVPTKLLDMCDAFFSSAGSAWVCARSGVPTIVYDVNDLRPIGLLDRTTKNCLYRNKKEPPVDFSYLMNQILIEKKYKRIAPYYESGLPDFQSHMDFIKQSASDKAYYDVFSIKAENTAERFHKMAIGIMGDVNYNRLLKIKDKL